MKDRRTIKNSRKGAPVVPRRCALRLCVPPPGLFTCAVVECSRRVFRAESQPAPRPITIDPFAVKL